MADSKITALASISTSTDPAVDPLVIVDVSDTSMAASGTSKKVTLNNLLSSSPTATGNFTITGDLTVDTSTLKVDSTNNRVGIVQATPLYPLHLVGEFGLEEASSGNGTKLRLIGDATKYNFRLGKQLTASNTFEITPSTAIGGTTFSNPVYTVTYNGIHTFLDGAGGTAMTLNSTGLGIGVSPGSAIGNLQVGGSSNANLYTQQGTDTVRMGVRASGRTGILFDSSNATYTNRAWYLDNVGSSGSLIIGRQGLDVITFDNVGNVGVGVTPSAHDAGKGLEVGALGNGLWCNNSTYNQLLQNATYNGGFKYAAAASTVASRLEMSGGFNFHIAPAGTSPNAITFTQAMTLNATGALLVGCTSAPNPGAATTASGFSINGIGNDAYISSKMDNSSCGYFRRDGTDGVVLNFYKANSSVGTISLTATVCTFNSISDYRLKEAVKPITSGLARVNALKPASYKWKLNGSDGEGFLAHELADVVPIAVTGKKDAVNADGSIDAQAIDMSRIVPILVAAIQELTAEVNALKNA